MVGAVENWGKWGRVLWHVGALVSVKQGARVGDCKGVEKRQNGRRMGNMRGGRYGGAGAKNKRTNLHFLGKVK